jgi:glycosyltransferase involved in cell wall biosynthesis
LVLVRLLGCRAILHLHSGAFVEWASGSPRRKRLVRYVLGLADSLVVLSPLWQSAIADVLEISDTVVIPNPVRIPEAPLSPAQRDLVLYTGRLIPLKGVSDLVEAAGILQERGHKIEFVLAGVGSELDKIRERASQLPAPELVRTPGWLSWKELQSLLQQSKVFCLPSFAEGQPLSLLEAMAAGVACVASDVGGIPSLITHKATGLLVQPGNPEEIADAIEFLYEHPDEGLRVGEAAKAHVTRNFGIEATLGELESLYSRLGYPPAIPPETSTQIPPCDAG